MTIRLHLPVLAVLAPVLCASALFGAAPPLREQISLNGAWRQGGAVPVYAGDDFDAKTYSRAVDVPAAWAGKRIRLDFGAVNFIASVFVDGRKAAEHIGGWTAFSVDVTDLTKPGRSFELRLDVLDRTHPPISDEHGKMLWPLGGETPSAGIVDDVWLRAYGDVCIEDAQIITSVRHKTLEVRYTVRNTTARTARVVVAADVVQPGRSGIIARAASQAVEIPAGEVRKAIVTRAWGNGGLWWPDRPTLYYLQSKLLRDGKTVDQETRRFGFREIWIEGNQFRLNGVRMNFRSDWVLFGQPVHWGAEAYTPEGWAKAVDQVKSMNVNLVRLHKHPAPQFAMDTADEKGLCLVAESAINSAGIKSFVEGFDKPAYMANALKWVADWIPSARNHPSIMLWSTSNEMYVITPQDAHTIESVIRTADDTRPIGSEDVKNDGAGEDVGFDTVSLHYPRRGDWNWNAQPWGNDRGIYAWKEFLSPGKPTVTGECLWVPGPPALREAEQQRTMWWQGIWTRGMRYNGWAQIGPPVWRGVKDEPPGSLRVANLKNAFSAVAVFDKAYDELGIAPFVGSGHDPIEAWPEVDAGGWQDRTLVLYNDEFRDTGIDVAVRIEVDGKTVAQGSKAFTVQLGEHRDLPYRFQAPFAGGKTMTVVFQGFKGKQLRFEESRHFRLRKAGQSGKSSDRIQFGDSAANRKIENQQKVPKDGATSN